jgi:hypothetical protein
MHYFSWSGGLSAVSTKSALGLVTSNLCLCFCISAMKHRCTFFHAQWDQYRFHKKRTGTRYVELVVLHPVGSAGHVVHSGA